MLTTDERRMPGYTKNSPELKLNKIKHFETLQAEVKVAFIK